MKKGRSIYRLTCVALIAALLSVGAMITVPLTVPVTLQTLVLYLSLLVFGGRLTSLSVTVYIAIGAVGAPVFAGFSGGVGRLFDATGGFLFGMLISSVIFWILAGRLGRGVSLAVSVATLHLCGAFWYYVVYLGDGGSLGAAFLACVLPFLIPEGLKLGVAALTARRLRTALKGYI